LSPRAVVERWIEAFNAGDAAAMAGLYHDDAVNHQVVRDPVRGRGAIVQMFAEEFARFDMHCMVENLFEDGEWAILEWRDPKGLRGCGFFRVRDGMIAFQRGYWDRASFAAGQG